MSWKNDQVTDKETVEILRLAKEALLVEGDFVEMGCYKGDTSLLLAEVLRDGSGGGGRGGRGGRGDRGGAPVEKDVQKSVKKLWIYDSFEGLPEKSKFDESVLGVDFKGGELFVAKREVKERFLRAGLPVPVIRKGWFSELTEKDMPEKIAFSFLDGDFYESIRDSLRLVAPRMVTNGVLVVHDYSNPALPGVKKAVDEFMSDFDMDMGAEFRVILL